MQTYTFKIRSRKFVAETERNYRFASSKKGMKFPFDIPKNQVLKFDREDDPQFYRKPGDWITVTVTEWVWHRENIKVKLKRYLSSGVAVISGEIHYGVNWDYVISKRKDKKRCFFCEEKLNSKTKTADHLISRAILHAYGVKGGLPNNTVPCCYECNQEKGSFHLETFREYAKRMISDSSNPKYRTIMFTLNQVLKI